MSKVGRVSYKKATIHHYELKVSFLTPRPRPLALKVSYLGLSSTYLV